MRYLNRWHKRVPTSDATIHVYGVATKDSARNGKPRESDSAVLAVKTQTFTVSAIVTLGLIGALGCGGGPGRQTANTTADTYEKVASDAVDQYNLARQNGKPIDQCVQARVVAAAFLGPRTRTATRSGRRPRPRTVAQLVCGHSDRPGGTHSPSAASAAAVTRRSSFSCSLASHRRTRRSDRRRQSSTTLMYRPLNPLSQPARHPLG